MTSLNLVRAGRIRPSVLIGDVFQRFAICCLILPLTFLILHWSQTYLGPLSWTRWIADHVQWPALDSQRVALRVNSGAGAADNFDLYIVALLVTALIFPLLTWHQWRRRRQDIENPLKWELLLFIALTIVLSYMVFFFDKPTIQSTRAFKIDSFGLFYVRHFLFFALWLVCLVDAVFVALFVPRQRTAAT